MGILPLQYKPGENRETLGLKGDEEFDIVVDNDLATLGEVKVSAKSLDGKVKTFTTTCRIDTLVEKEYYQNGGILHSVLKNLLRQEKANA